MSREADSEELFLVGKVAGPHGINGAIKAFPLTDYPEERFAESSVLLLEVDGKLTEVQVKASKKSGKFYLIKLKGFDSRNDAESLKNCSFFVKRSQLKKLKENQFWIEDIVNCWVYFEGERLGKIEEVITGPSNDSYVVKGEREFIIPATKEAIESIDIDKKLLLIKDMSKVVES